MRPKMVMNNVTVVQTKLWCVVVVAVMVMEAAALNGPNVCMVQQKYNITKRVKYRAPMSVRTYEWCFSMPPRCSKWKTEMRELTKLETDERIAEVAVCCPGYKMKEVSCVPICPNGKTGHRCSEDCPPNKWGPNCVNECESCNSGSCSPTTGDCFCQDGWQGESCEIRISPSTSTTMAPEDLLTKSATKTTPPTIPSTRPALVRTTSTKSVKTTAPSRTTLLESNSQPHRLKPILEIPAAMTNKSTVGSPSFTISTTLPDNPTSIMITTTKPTSALTASPTSSPITTTTTHSTSTTLETTPNIIPTTNEATMVLDTTTVQTVSPIQATEASTTEHVIAAAPANVTSLAPNVEEKVLDNKENVFMGTTESAKLTTLKDNLTSTSRYDETEQTTSKMTSIYNPTKVPIMVGNTNHELKVPVKIRTDTIKVEIQHNTVPPKTISFNNVSVVHFTTTPFITTTGGPTKIETTKRPPSTIRYFPTTVKFKPKEIWIRPAQKGESFLKIKTEMNQDIHSKPRTDTNDLNTTPKTIMVSIIPTSVSYASFKKVALTTATLLSQKTNMFVAIPNETAREQVTRPMMITSTETPISTNLRDITGTILIDAKLNKTKDTHSSKPYTDRTTITFPASQTTTKLSKNLTISKNGTNSMTTMGKDPNSPILLTIPSTNAIRTTQLPNITLESKSVTKPAKPTKQFTKIVTMKPRNVTIITVSGKNKNETVVKITKTIATDVEKTNATRIKDIISKTNPVTTESPDDEEKFHILTEPEHITAVMEGKGKERTSVDLISVISIAGGIMMAVITVAVIIVMVERCKRPRYDDVRKVSDIRMQVMIDNNDVPPPYVRSIFHTPLPDPPTSEKCHYQPISTLDRNLKQFMRPVVVQSISPIMLENFRGILECHYDHLPRRNHNFDTSQRHCSLAPSLDDVDELTHLRPCSTMESTIEALKCEARLDVIDSTTSEPLYAEIPCWRPPSEHAIEIMNLNGEAVTEL